MGIVLKSTDKVSFSGLYFLRLMELFQTTYLEQLLDDEDHFVMDMYMTCRRPNGKRSNGRSIIMTYENSRFSYEYKYPNELPVE
jgi:hypothetical protein